MARVSQQQPPSVGRRKPRSILSDAIMTSPENPTRLRHAMLLEPDETMGLPLPGGKSALGLAIARGRSINVIRTLLMGGAMVNATDLNGCSPLQILLQVAPQQLSSMHEAVAVAAAAADPSPQVVTPDDCIFFTPGKECGYRQAGQQVLLLRRQAIILLRAGALPPPGGAQVKGAPGNEACALMVQEYRDLLPLAVALRRNKTGRYFHLAWGDIVAFLSTTWKLREHPGLAIERVICSEAF